MAMVMVMALVKVMGDSTSVWRKGAKHHLATRKPHLRFSAHQMGSLENRLSWISTGNLVDLPNQLSFFSGFTTRLDVSAPNVTCCDYGNRP